MLHIFIKFRDYACIIFVKNLYVKTACWEDIAQLKQQKLKGDVTYKESAAN